MTSKPSGMLPAEPSSTPFDSIEDALVAIAAGEMVVVVDDDDRENEGDLIMAAPRPSPRRWPS